MSLRYEVEVLELDKETRHSFNSLAEAQSFFTKVTTEREGDDVEVSLNDLQESVTLLT